MRRKVLVDKAKDKATTSAQMKAKNLMKKQVIAAHNIKIYLRNIILTFSLFLMV